MKGAEADFRLPVGRNPRGNQDMSWTDRAKLFWREMLVETLHKVTWPTREELAESTMVVLVTVLIISAFIYIVDLAVNHLITWIL